MPTLVLAGHMLAAIPKQTRTGPDEGWRIPEGISGHKCRRLWAELWFDSFLVAPTPEGAMVFLPHTLGRPAPTATQQPK